MLNLSPILQYISAIVIVGGGVVSYTSFENSKTRYDMERFIEHKMDSIPSQTANIMMPQLTQHIENTMVKAGLVDYHLIFKNDSIGLATMYTKLQASSRDLADAAVNMKFENEKSKFYSKLFSITYGKTTLLFEWKYNPQLDRWELNEIE